MSVDDRPGTRELGWVLGFPRWWWVVAVGVALLSVVIVLTRGIAYCPWWQTDSLRVVPKGKWPLVVGIYLFFLSAGHIIIQLLQRLYEVLSTLELPRADRWRTEDRERALNRSNTFPPAFVGFVEGILYPTSLLTGKPEFIAAWIVLKVAGQWKTWETEHAGRRVFNRFLFGSGLLWRRHADLSCRSDVRALLNPQGALPVVSSGEAQKDATSRSQ